LIHQSISAGNYWKLLRATLKLSPGQIIYTLKIWRISPKEIEVNRNESCMHTDKPLSLGVTNSTLKAIILAMMPCRTYFISSAFCFGSFEGADRGNG